MRCNSLPVISAARGSPCAGWAVWTCRPSCLPCFCPAPATCAWGQRQYSLIKLHVQYLTLASEDQRRQLGCVEKKKKRWDELCRDPRGGGGGGGFTGMLLWSRYFIEMQREWSANEVKLSPLSCVPRWDARLVKQWKSSCDGRTSLPAAWAHLLAEGEASRSKPRFWLSAPGNSSG